MTDPAITSWHRKQQAVVACFIFLYLACSVQLMVAFSLGCVGSGYTGLDSSPYGKHSRPVVYRVLIPNVARAVHAMVPAALERPLTRQLIRWRDTDAVQNAIKAQPPRYRHPPLSDDLIFETAVAFFVCYLTLLAFLWMFYTLARALFPESLAYALMAPLLILQVLTGLSPVYAYIYDFAELFFTCALFYLLFKERWGLYLFCLALGTLNKETTIFTIFFYAVWFWHRLPMKRYLQLLGLQVAIYIIIKGGITYYYASLPGEMGHLRFYDQVLYFSRLPVITFMNLVLVAFAVSYRWREKPAFMRAGLCMLLPNLLSFILICNPGEYRDFYWVLPMLTLMATHSLVSGEFAHLPVFVTADARAA